MQQSSSSHIAIRLRLTWMGLLVTLHFVTVEITGTHGLFANLDLGAEPEAVETSFIVEDETASPISGAYIIVTQTRPREASQWYDLPAEWAPSSACVRTDASGKGTLSVPRDTFCWSSFKETVFARVQISHPEYQTALLVAAVDPTIKRVTLSRGCTVGYSAIDESGHPIVDFGVRMAGKIPPQHWYPLQDGGLEAHSTPMGSWQTMLVQHTAGRTRFSDLFVTPALPNRSLHLRDIRMRPGIEVRGKLSADVPRPVSAGHVLAVSLPRPAESVWDGNRPSLQWIDRAAIDENGTFCFQSLPRSGQLQLIAVCDGWISATHDKNLPYVAGKLYAVDGIDLEVEIEMQALGTATVIVETEDGRPVANAQIALNPQQLLWRGNTMLLGGYVLSIESILAQRSGTLFVERACLESGLTWYRQLTGADGTVRLKNIPTDRSQFVDIYHHEFEHAAPELDRQRWLRISDHESREVVHRVIVSPRG